MLVVILDIVATIALCLYLANGQMALFEKGGFRNLMNRLKSTVTEEEPEEEAKLEAVSFRQAFQNFIGCKRLWFFGIAVALVSFGFYAWREFEIINAPLLNLKYMLLLYLFFAAAVVDAHYSIIPNKLIVTGLVFWVLLCIFTVFVEKNSIITLLKFSGCGALFGGGVLLLCRVLMKNSMGYGDIKLLTVTGLICGFYKTFNILFYSLLVLFVVGLILIFGKKVNRHAKIPMGPFLLLGYLVAGVIGI